MQVLSPVTLHSNLGEFYMKACVPVRKENIEATPGQAKGKLGGVCWRSLNAKFNRQLNMEKDEYTPNT